jgi:hypothetical protein
VEGERGAGSGYRNVRTTTERRSRRKEQAEGA